MGVKKTNIFLVNTNECTLLQRNPQYLTPKQMESLKKSIRRDGFVVPILVRKVGKKFQVISGNHRLLAARELRMSAVPAVLSRISDRDAKRLAINLNTIHGEPNAELLAPFLADCDDALLRELHLEAAQIDDLLDFDAELATKLSVLDAPGNLDKNSNPNSLPTCKCPKCGKKHAPVDAE